MFLDEDFEVLEGAGLALGLDFDDEGDAGREYGFEGEGFEGSA